MTSAYGWQVLVFGESWVLRNCFLFISEENLWQDFFSKHRHSPWRLAVSTLHLPGCSKCGDLIHAVRSGTLNILTFRILKSSCMKPKGPVLGVSFFGGGRHHLLNTFHSWDTEFLVFLWEIPPLGGGGGGGGWGCLGTDRFQIIRICLISLWLWGLLREWTHNSFRLRRHGKNLGLLRKRSISSLMRFVMWQ